MRQLGRHSTLALLVLGLSAGAAQAHQQRVAIGGNSVLIKTNSTPARQRFVFKTSKQPLVVVNHDPTTEGGWVLVHGTGSGGVHAGKTGMIALYPTKWKQTSTGWVYKDPDGSYGGIKRLVFRNGSQGGTLKIVAGGPSWPWNVGGPQDDVWVQFKIQNEWFCARFGSPTIKNETGYFKAKNAPAAGACPEVCGNGQIEGTEACDDGNLVETDGCASDCTITPCSGEQFDSTWEALQARLFDDGGCTNSICHAGAFPAGNLNLEPANAYANIFNHTSSISTFDRIEPGDQDLSFLYLKLAAATLGGSYSGVAGSPMPAGGLPPISNELLSALRLWIRAGAPETGTVAGTAELLASCLPPDSPNKLPPLDPPAFGAGVQLYAPPWDLPAQSEDEVCYATYYDFSATPGLVPASAQTPCPTWLGGPTKTCFRYHETLLGQDPQSHHSIIHIYTGTYPTTNNGFAPWTCKTGPNQGQTCNPLNLGSDCGGIRNACAGKVVSSVACLGYGPPDYGFNSNVAPTFGGSQEALSGQTYAPGVYNVLPLKGIVVWNSHAFNLTETDTTMEQYYNLTFAGAADQQYQVQAVFDDTEIFTQQVPPFETREYCRTFTFPQNARLFQFSSHTHRFGKLFRIWGPPNNTCTASGGCLPSGSAPIYVSTQYNDPVQLGFDPPVALTSADATQRTYKFCALYDNGATDVSKVKRYSTSPVPPLIFAPGGPCDVSETKCIGGSNHGAACNGSDVVCLDGGVCDACIVRGGVTTEDEMFILLGSYYVP